MSKENKAVPFSLMIQHPTPQFLFWIFCFILRVHPLSLEASGLPWPFCLRESRCCFSLFLLLKFLGGHLCHRLHFLTPLSSYLCTVWFPPHHSTAVILPKVTSSSKPLPVLVFSSLSSAAFATVHFSSFLRSFVTLWVFCSSAL